MDRLQIAFFGATNSGKSTLVNALAGQEVSLVSELPGTTTDPVRKVIELPELGPCVLVDTAGFGDPGALGAERERRSRSTRRTRRDAERGFKNRNKKEQEPAGNYDKFIKKSRRKR